MFHRKKGFTLIELLVVISIIAVLLSILMPALKKAKDKARSVICRSNLKQWALPFGMYAQDNNDKFMRGWEDGPYPDGSGGMTWMGKQWMNQLRPYYSNVHNFCLCPMTKIPKTDRRTGGSVFEAWANLSGTADNATMKGDYGSYGMNTWAYNPQGTYFGEHTAQWHWRGPNIRNPGKIPLFSDNAVPDIWVMDPVICEPPPDEADSGVWWDTAEAQMWRVCMKRHQRRGINMLFMDFSVDEVGLKRLWRLKWYKGFDTNGPWAQPDAPWPEWMRSLSDN